MSDLTSQTAHLTQDPFEPWEREMRGKLYEIARDYWRTHDIQERLALTDHDLDEQFWLIDHEGIPRLLSEQGTIQLPPDPLEAILGIFDDDVTDMSVTVRETIDAYYQEKLEQHDRAD
jgi:hypothetical protein